LFTADVILRFTLDELSTKNTPLGFALKNSLMKRIIERRTINSAVFYYLNTRNMKIPDVGDNYNNFNVNLNKFEMATLIGNLIHRILKPEKKLEEIDDVFE
jgi:hypothetical protein